MLRITCYVKDLEASRVEVSIWTIAPERRSPTRQVIENLWKRAGSEIGAPGSRGSGAIVRMHAGWSKPQNGTCQFGGGNLKLPCISPNNSMPILFAEDIGGWLVAGFLFLGGIAATLFALGALFPAAKGNRPVTIVLLIPAVVMVLWVTGYLVNAYMGRVNHDAEEIRENYVQPWLLMACPELVVGLAAIAVLIFKRRRTSQK